MPKVSVVIPVYNTADYLRACLDSILGQTLEDIEVICVDDGSTDGSASILAEYGRRDPRFRVIREENRGQSAARNRGAGEARGEYLHFVDSDDFLGSDALERLYALACVHHASVVYFGAEAFFEDAELESRFSSYSTYYSRSDTYPGVFTGRELLRQMCDAGDHRPHVGLQFIAAEHYRRAGLSFYEGIIHEDNLFTLVCGVRAERALCIPDVFYHRRLRAGSTMTLPVGVASLRGYLVSYVEIVRLAVKEELDEAAASAVAQVGFDMYRNALRVYRRMPESERGAVGLSEFGPDGRILVEAFLLHGEQMLAGEMRGARRVSASADRTGEGASGIARDRAYAVRRRMGRLLRRVGMLIRDRTQ